MTLTVLSVAYPLATVSTESVGGAEQVLAAIDRALVTAGARSIVVACDGSASHGVLVATPKPREPYDDNVRFAARHAHEQAIRRVLDRETVDVIHFHGVDYHTYLPEPGAPALATLHLAHCWYPRDAAIPTRPRTFVHCVSDWQRQFFESSPSMLPTIQNGVAIPRNGAGRRKQRYALSLGRICPEKGFHLALDAAQRAGMPMRLAGQVFGYPAHRRYFEAEIVPRLDADRWFIGPRGGEQKQRLLSEARCVLIPSIVPETSSLVAMEALAAGTPVIAFSTGALPEIVEHGVTGFIVHDEVEMAEAIVAAGAIDPEVCRAAAIARFSAAAMTRKYLARYRDLGRERAEGMARVSLPVQVSASARGRMSEAAVVTRADELEQLVDEWRLLCQSADSGPFQRPEWLLPWWRHFGNGDLRAIVVRHDGELAGLVPLYLRSSWQADRELAFVGSGNTDYLDVVTARSRRDAVGAALFDFLRGSAGEWDRCTLGPLPERSPLLALSMPNDLRATRRPVDVCPTLRVNAAMHGDVIAAASPSMLKQLRYGRRRLARERGLSIRQATDADASSLFDVFCELHTARWRSRGANGVLDESRARAFHSDVVRGMASAGLLRLYLLDVAGSPAAAFYGFADRHRWFYYLGGFAPEFARYSAGSLIVLHALEQAAIASAGEFDFLRGAESYKYRWGAKDTRIHACELTHTSSAASGEAAGASA